MSPSITVRVPAKVNIHLAVHAARPDGFHDLSNVFLAVGLYDEVTASLSDSLRVSCSGPEAQHTPLGCDNLAHRAAARLAAHHDIKPAVHLHLSKHIPVAGGMAGGSADAAGALLACDTLWETSTSSADLLALCAQLGSDVPFSMAGGAALGTGRGDRLAPLEVNGTFRWVLAVADAGLSTPAVYQEFDRLDDGPRTADPAIPRALLDALRGGDAAALADSLRNDLQAAALSLNPMLGATLLAGTEAGALEGLVCGSGPTTAFLAADSASAMSIAGALLKSGTCRTVHVVEGPVAGATVIG